jgi:bromodomain adjacent to zinc finger domain protein 1A
VNKCERKLEGIERDFRKLVGIGRAKPMGKDRFYNSYWWLDGLGGGGLVGGGGVAQYGTGRLFVQGPNEIDLEVMMNEKGEEVAKKRLEMEGEDEMLATGEWACYAEVEDVSPPRLLYVVRY